MFLPENPPLVTERRHPPLSGVHTLTERFMSQETGSAKHLSIIWKNREPKAHDPRTPVLFSLFLSVLLSVTLCCPQCSLLLSVLPALPFIAGRNASEISGDPAQYSSSFCLRLLSRLSKNWSKIIPFFRIKSLRYAAAGGIYRTLFHAT